MASDERATRPEDLTRLFLERANAGDAAGVAELYAPDAVHALPDGTTVVGREAIRDLFTRILADQPTFSGQELPVLSDGELAITSTRVAEDELTVEVARRQGDGTWLWVLDQPNLLG